MSNKSSQQAIILGEVLFDTFPDGSVVMGGAPFNVAWHLQGFGFNPVLVSRVGDDALGKQVLSTMLDWGMSTAGLQVDRTHPTGAVNVSITNGQPSFTILPDQAYDFIDCSVVSDLFEGQSVACLYHGSLALRRPESAQQIFQLQKNLDLSTFVDINLRPPWWKASLVSSAMAGATWAKVNDEELLVLRGVSECSDAELVNLAVDYLKTTGLDLLILTLGAKGAVLVTQSGVIEGQPVPVENMVDTVGAGDAFSSVVLVGLLCHWELSETLERALAFASAICGQRGATADNPALYQQFLSGW